jgi:putative transposase
MASRSVGWEAAEETSWTTWFALNERHLKRLLLEYVRYHHEDRTHLGLEKGTPEGRIRSEASGRVLSQERLGGLHHRYNRAA